MSITKEITVTELQCILQALHAGDYPDPFDSRQASEAECIVLSLLEPPYDKRQLMLAERGDDE
jgi:hypothetical protein